MNREYSEEERFQLLHQVAELYDPEIGPWAYNTWKQLNQKYFKGEIQIWPIGWGLTKYAHRLGFADGLNRKIVLHTSLINPRSKAWGQRGLLGERFAADVLLHEMIHQYIFQTERSVGEPHNCQMWCDELNRLIPLLGFTGKATVSKQRRVKEPGTKGSGRVTWLPSGDGTMIRKELSTWPYTSRPEEYYEISCREMLAAIRKSKEV